MAKILIVSADFNFATMLEARLLMEYHEVTLAEDGALGLQKALTWKPQLIILDAALPKMSGYQLVEKLKARGQALRLIPIIVVLDRESMQHLFREKDIFYYCAKPVTPALFLKQVAAAVQNAPAASEPSEKIPTNLLRESRVLVAGVQEYILSKIQKFFEEQGYAVEIGWDENDTVQKAERMVPEIIFVQFWENTAVFHAPRLVEELTRKPKLNQTSIVVFCRSKLAQDAACLLPGAKVIPHFESLDLIDKIKQLMAVDGLRVRRRPAR